MCFTSLCTVLSPLGLNVVVLVVITFLRSTVFVSSSVSVSLLPLPLTATACVLPAAAPWARSLGLVYVIGMELKDMLLRTFWPCAFAPP